MELSKHLKALFACLALLAILDESAGDFSDPPIEGLPDSPTGIVVDPAADGKSKITIPENIPEEPTDPPVRIAKILVTDLVNDKIEIYSLSLEPLRSLFVVEQDATSREWFLSLKQGIDFESLTSPAVIMQLSNAVQTGVYAVITLQFTDVNDNPVQITGYQPALKEDYPEGKFDDSGYITTVTWDDKDLLDNEAGKISFVLEHTNGGDGFFTIDRSGQIFQVKEMDYQQSATHRLKITVFDSEDIHSDSIPLTIDVKDLPGLEPVWNSRPPMITLDEFPNTQIGYVAETIRASDGDSGLDWKITYSLVETGHDEVAKSFFEINPTTGAITVIAEIDAEELYYMTGELTFELEVTATEVVPLEYEPLDPKSISDRITVNIRDINDHKPEVCRSDAVPWDDNAACAINPPYQINLAENWIGSLPLEQPFVIRDLDATLPYSKYSVKFAGGTGSVITESFDIQPSRDSSGVTEYTLSVKNATALDYERDDDFWLSPPTEFKIVATDLDTGDSIDATFQVTLEDVNDNSPIFVDETGAPVTEYRFLVCENLQKDYVLKKLNPDPLTPKLCPGEGTDSIVIRATDQDGSAPFNTVKYDWSSTRRPAIDIDEDTGEMKVNAEDNFNFERLELEEYVVRAFDNPTDPSNQRSTLISVIFEVLDKNDRSPDLKITPSRVQMFETPETNIKVELVDDAGDPVELSIVAEDTDVSALLELKIETARRLTRNSDDSYTIADEECDIQKWFKLVPLTPEKLPTGERLRAELHTAEQGPDREGCGVDRVDLTIVATDRNQLEGGDEPAFVSQTLTIIIKDVNDSPPVWEETSPVQASVQETTTPVNDTASTQREIMTLRATDPDTNTIFTFTYEGRDCVNDDVCEEMRNLVEIDDGNNGQGNSNGRVVLRRRLGVSIDREETKFYGGVETDFLAYTIWVSDGIHTIPVDVDIEVIDINDNSPVWEGDFANPPPTVNEGVEIGADPIIIFGATDADKKPGQYANINYIFTKDSIDQGIEQNFELDEYTGALLAIPGSYNWTAVKSYTFVVLAIDNYREGITAGSNSVDVIMTVVVEDTNNHPPEFMTARGQTVISIRETAVEADVPLAGEPIEIRDQDDPTRDGNGLFSVEVVKVVRENTDELVDPTVFRTGNLILVDLVDNRKKVEIIATTKFTELKPLWGTYLVTFKAQDEGIPSLNPVEEEYRIKVINENLNTPVFEYPASANTSTILVGTDVNTLPNRPVKTFKGIDVDYIKANDDDDEENGNGRLTYFIEPTDDLTDGSAYFDIRNDGAELGCKLMLKASLVDSKDVRFYTIVLVTCDNPDDPDEDSRCSSATLTIFLTPGVNRQPIFNEMTPQSVEIPENDPSFSVTLREAYDPDEGLIEDNPDYPELGELIGDQSIVYTIINGSVEDYNDIFEIIKEENSKVPILKTKRALDREDIDQYELTVQVTNPDSSSIPPDPRGTITIIVNVGDEKDTSPQFAQPGIISGGISQNTEQGSVVATVEVYDLDLNDNMTFTMSTQVNASNPGLPTTPFEIDQNGRYTAYIRILFAPQPSMSGYYTFELTATDLGSFSTTAQVKIYIVKSSNEIPFRFFNRRDEVEAKRTRLTEILTDSFGYRCNIDRINDDGTNLNVTILRTHFVDLVQNEPVEAVYISEQQYDPLTYSKLLSSLSAEGIILNSNGIGNQYTPEANNGDKLTIYLLIGGAGVLAVGLLVLSTTCFFNNRSLQRRVRSLTATTFGSQNSGLNRVGATMELPNTNEFAIEGSNPMWSTNPADREKNVPAFDAESIGSGGSVLIGVEDDDDFKNYKGTSNPAMDVNGNVNDSDADYTEDLYETTPTKNYLYESDASDHSDNTDNTDNDSSPPALSLPPTSRRNPLLDM